MINKVILLGNVGNDPEVRYVSEGLPVARFSLATSESYTNKAGEKVTNTEWHSIVLWRGLATVVEKYIKKGAQVYIEGKITYRTYEKDGQTKYFTEIVADEMKMIGRKDKDGTEQSADVSQKRGAVAESAPAYDIPPAAPADDLPF